MRRRDRHARIGRRRRRRPKAAQQRLPQHGFGFHHRDLRRAKCERLRRTKPARAAQNQNPRAVQQRVGRPIQRRTRMLRDRLPVRQGRNPRAVAIQTEGPRRRRHAQPTRIVRHIHIQPLGEIVEQLVHAARRQNLRHHAAVRHVQRRIDRLELVHPRRGQREHRGLRRHQHHHRRGTPAHATRQHRRHRQKRQKRGHQQEGMHHKHQHQRQHRAAARPQQVIAVHAPDLVRMHHEVQRHRQARQEEERKQRRIIQRDVHQLRLGRRRVLQLQRIEPVQRDANPPGATHRQHRDRQGRQQPPRMPQEHAPPQHHHHARDGKPRHGDGNHPVAVLRPARDGEEARQRDLDPHRRTGDEEQRNQGLHQDQTALRARKSSTAALKRAGSSTNSACPALSKISTVGAGCRCATASAWPRSRGVTA